MQFKSVTSRSRAGVLTNLYCAIHRLDPQIKTPLLENLPNDIIPANHARSGRTPRNGQQSTTRVIRTHRGADRGKYLDGGGVTVLRVRNCSLKGCFSFFQTGSVGGIGTCKPLLESKILVIWVWGAVTLVTLVTLAPCPAGYPVECHVCHKCHGGCSCSSPLLFGVDADCPSASLTGDVPAFEYAVPLHRCQ